MDSQTAAVLAAMYLAVHENEERGEAQDFGVLDTCVADAGDRIFGMAWTPVKHGADFVYAPAVSMSLGRLRSAGYVRAKDVSNASDLFDAQHTQWLLTDEGRALAELMFGPADGLASSSGA